MLALTPSQHKHYDEAFTSEMETGMESAYSSEDEVRERLSAAPTPALELSTCGFHYVVTRDDEYAYKFLDYSRAVVAAQDEANGSGAPWSVLDPHRGWFLVVSERDALDLFPSSIISTIGPVVVR